MAEEVPDAEREDEVADADDECDGVSDGCNRVFDKVVKGVSETLEDDDKDCLLLDVEDIVVVWDVLDVDEDVCREIGPGLMERGWAAVEMGP